MTATSTSIVFAASLACVGASLTLAACGGDDRPDVATGDVGQDGDAAQSAEVEVYENCFNGVDDTGNGLIDCADPQCGVLEACQVYQCPHGILGDAIGFPVYTGSTVGARNDLAGTCGGQAGPDLAFVWTAPADGEYFIDTRWGSYDTVLYVLEGGCDGPEVVCNDDATEPTALQSEVRILAREGEDYVIVVDSYQRIGRESGGEFVLNITPVELESEIGFCDDQRDNDGDGLTDCEDPDCKGVPECAPLNGIVAISAGEEHTCALDAGGVAYCWGAGAFGELGHGASVGSSRPVRVDAPVAFTGISAGARLTCAVTEAGAVWCWGDGASGRLLLPGGVNSAVPVEIPLPRSVTEVAVGGAHACALAGSGAVMCWGSNEHGQLGAGLGVSPAPGSVVQVEGIEDAVAVEVGVHHSCVVLQRGELLCWGLNRHKQVGRSGEWTIPTPTRVAEHDAVVAMACGVAHTCFVRSWNGTVSCFGQNGNGELGEGNTQSQSTPGRTMMSSRAVSLSAGLGHTCALDVDDTVWCWGQNGQGQVGTDVDQRVLRPTQVFGLGAVVAVAAGGAHTCALDDDGLVWCWGGNARGQLGDGTVVQRSQPARVRSVE